MNLIFRINGLSHTARLSIAAALVGTLCASVQPIHAQSYKLVDLGVVGYGGQPFHISSNGLIAGAVQTANGTDESVLYVHSHAVVLRNTLGGANSMAFGNNIWGLAVGGANSTTADNEDFCGFNALGLPSASTRCLPYLGVVGRMFALPTLGGNNGVANSINILGQVTGAAENTNLESSCPPTDAGVQKYQFKPVVWRLGKANELQTVGGDHVGVGLAINDLGQVAGGSGTCSGFNPQIYTPMQPAHAILWQADGTAIDLQSLGGDVQSFVGTMALNLNNNGQVVGFSTLAGDQAFHAFLWSQQTHTMQDLGTAAGLPFSSAISINDNGVIVGVSTDFSQFTATLWKNGIATDLNTLIPANSQLYLLSGCSINSKGQVIGVAIDAQNKIHGYELDPVIE